MKTYRSYLLILAAALLFVPLGNRAEAQPFILSTTPSQANISGGTITLKTTVMTEVGFSASIYFSAESPTLPLATITITPSLLNTPYSDTVRTTVSLTGPKTGGEHKVIITARNGAAVAHDTVTITIPNREAWRVIRDEELGPVTPWGLGWATRAKTAFDRERGVLWVVIEDTLRSYDGSTWSTHDWPDSSTSEPLYTPPLSTVGGSGGRVVGIALDREGKLWGAVTGPGTNGSALVIRDTNGVWDIIGSLDSANGHTPLLNQLLFFTYSGSPVMQFGANNELWISAYKGPVLYDGTSWTYFSYETSDLPGWNREMIVDKSGNLWVNTREGISKFDGTYWTSWSNWEYGLHNESHTIAADANGYIWCRAYNSSVRIHGDSNTHMSFYKGEFVGDPFLGDTIPPANTTFGSILGHNVTDVSVGPDGDFWIGMRTTRYGNDVYVGGVARFDGSTWYHYTIDNSGLPDNEVVMISVDDFNQVWIATEDRSLTILDGTASPYSAFSGETTSVDDRRRASEINLSLLPNPTTDRVTVNLQIPGLSETGTLAIYDAVGNEVYRVERSIFGTGSVMIETDDLPEGTYFVRFQSESTNLSRPLVILR